MHCRQRRRLMHCRCMAPESEQYLSSAARVGAKCIRLVETKDVDLDSVASALEERVN
jgi:hypothetical protein